MWWSIRTAHAFSVPLSRMSPTVSLDAMDDPEVWTEGDELSKRVWRMGRRVWRRPHEW